jgi:YafQ family addiction module toxin component
VYNVAISARLDKHLEKLRHKAPQRYAATRAKIDEIALKGPEHYKNLKYHLKEYRRVHIDAHFVLLFLVDEQRKTILFEDLDHHDRVYHR